ncbi:MAG: homocysteine S-methyltransferase family protein [Acidimicrobiales bacterium]
MVGETVSCIAEAEALAAAVEQALGPDELWLSFTVPDIPTTDTVVLRSGESIADAVEVMGSAM